MPTMILFDIDATLLLTGGVGGVAFERAFEKLFGVKQAWRNIVPHGKTDPIIVDEMAQQSLDRSLTLEEMKQVHQLYVEYFAEDIADAPNFRVLPGAESLLQELSQKSDVLLGVASGNWEATGWLKLERAALAHYFSFGGFGSDSFLRHELVSAAIKRGRAYGELSTLPKERIFVVGDAPQDVQAGRTLGVKTVAVTTGRTSREEMAEYEPDFVLDSLLEKEAFMQALDGK